MSKFKAWHVGPWMVLAALLLGSTTGCQAISAMAYVLFPAEERVDPQYPLVTKRKEEKRVAIITYASSQLLWQFESLDEELARALGRELQEREERLTLVSPRKIQNWKDTNPRWAEVEMAQVGEEFDVDYVMWVDINSFSMHETKNQWLLKGRSSVTLRVYDMNESEVIVEQDHEEEYPKNGPISVTELPSENQFKRQLVKQLAKKVSWFVVPHHPQEEMMGESRF